MKILKKLIIILIVFQIFIIGCLTDAERDNPLDPKSKKYQQLGMIRGKIYSYYPPFRTLDGVDVFLDPGYYWTKSNQDGEFVFSNLPPNEYFIHVTCAGYAADSAMVHLDAGKEVTPQFNLNALPIIENHQIIVGHISRWWPTDDLYILKVLAEVSDPDGLADILKVKISLPGLNFTDSLSRTNNPALFNGIYYENQLPINSLHQSLGHPFFLEVYDYPNSCTISSPIYIARIIDDTPVALSPQRPDTLMNPEPRLEWQPMKLAYYFTFKIEVYRIEQGINTLVWDCAELFSDSTAVQVNNGLPSGSYFWTVSIEDEFGNWSRSKEAAFTVR